MIYFSYNDYMDYAGEIDEEKRVEENIEKYEIRNFKTKFKNNKYDNPLVKILKERIEMKTFLEKFFNFNEVKDLNNINYCYDMQIKKGLDNNTLICKINDKEIYIFVYVLEKIDNNISYKMLEYSINIIKKWERIEKGKYRRYPIVIPIAIYIGKEEWKINSYNIKNIKYIRFEENKIKFSYNLLKINLLKIEDLKHINSKFARELIKYKDL